MLILYGTLGCHLCDMAEDIIAPFQQKGAFTLEKHDIADDDTLMTLYGVRIPVVKDTATGKELGWPFDHDIFQTWLDALNT